MEENLKILLCEDDENLGMLLREYLQAKGYEAVLCPDGEAGYREFQKTKFDICVLDVMMPKKDGFSLAQDIRQQNAELPIIFLTAKTLKEDILEGFKIGADDYITKPFSPKEMVLRVNNIIKRVYKEDARINVDGYLIDEGKRIVYDDNNNVIDLTTKEFDLLMLFVKNRGTAFLREQILEKVWDDNYFGSDRVVDDTLRRLRKKMPNINIQTIYGFGYRLS